MRVWELDEFLSKVDPNRLIKFRLLKPRTDTFWRVFGMHQYT